MRGAPSPDKIDPFGPTFLSYRQSDGTELATTVAWALRTMGLPVWRDIDDLPPGDTNTRLQEAMSDGLSGAVLLVTQGVAQSTAIKEIEAPQLLRLHADPGFSFAIGNAIRREGAEEPRFSGRETRLISLGILRGGGWPPSVKLAAIRSRSRYGQGPNRQPRSAHLVYPSGRVHPRPGAGCRTRIAGSHSQRCWPTSRNSLRSPALGMSKSAAEPTCPWRWPWERLSLHPAGSI